MKWFIRPGRSKWTHSFRVEALLSIQRALWEQVTPNLRGVSIGAEGTTITGHFLLEHVGPTEREIVAETETYVLADFVPPVDVFFIPVASDPTQPRHLHAGEEWVYLRREALWED